MRALVKRWKFGLSGAGFLLAIGLAGSPAHAEERVLACKVIASGTAEIEKLATSFSELMEEVDQVVTPEDETQAGAFRDLYDKRFGGFQSTLSKAKASFRKRPAFRRCHLSDEELVAIFGYTSDDYNYLNQALRRGGDTLASIQVYVDVLNRALSKLDNFEGEVVRKANFLPDSVLEEHQVGAIVTYPAYTSTSIGYPLDGHFEFVIRSKTGKPIEEFANVEGEREVLFRPGTRFRVLERQKIDAKNWRFVMQEVPNQPFSPSPAALTVQVEEQDLDRIAE